MTTPAEKDAMALAVIEREANEISLCGGAMFANELREARAHLAARVAELEQALTFARQAREVAIHEMQQSDARATRAEAELAAVLAWLAKLESFVGPGALAYMRREFDAARGAGPPPA